ncbi:hypothetical protein FI667_g9830, partial [Globisporangium splendens]
MTNQTSIFLLNRLRERRRCRQDWASCKAELPSEQIERRESLAPRVSSDRLIGLTDFGRTVADNAQTNRARTHGAVLSVSRRVRYRIADTRIATSHLNPPALVPRHSSMLGSENNRRSTPSTTTRRHSSLAPARWRHLHDSSSIISIQLFAEFNKCNN